jgi:hypothetical protein
MKLFALITLLQQNFPRFQHQPDKKEICNNNAEI